MFAPRAIHATVVAGADASLEAVVMSSSPLTVRNADIVSLTRTPILDPDLLGRRGAVNPSLVPRDVIRALNAGAIATVNLMEVIAVDQSALAQSILAVEHVPNSSNLRSRRLLDRMNAGAALALEVLGDELWSLASTWASDVARGWAAMAVGLLPDIPLDTRLVLAMRFALDSHFAVREWAWLGVRRAILLSPHEAISNLTGAAQHPSPLARRFASEATRPIGVWSPHVPALREDPSPALPLLQRIYGDPAAYVRVSVGNWLNDASRDNPEWVTELCSRWSLETLRPDVFRRATRTIRRKRL